MIELYLYPVDKTSMNNVTKKKLVWIFTCGPAG